MVLDTLMRGAMAALVAVEIPLLVHLLVVQVFLVKEILAGLLVSAVVGLIQVIHILQVVVVVLALSVLLDLLEIQGVVAQAWHHQYLAHKFFTLAVAVAARIIFVFRIPMG
jgi:hypothetical protein